MNNIKQLQVFFAVILLLTSCLSYAQDYIKSDARSQSPSHIYQDEIFTLGDSCAVVNPERHDGYQHANGYPCYTDSMKYVIKMTPAQIPWIYTKVCIGFTSFGSPTFTYYIVMYDSTASGPGTNLLYISAPHTATSVPVFPLMGWYSSQDTLPMISGAVYLGIRCQFISGQNKFISIDENSATPLWPGYLSTISGPPVWSPIQNNYGSYRSACIRTEGLLFVGINNNNNKVPDKFSLSQNYPNPFNPTTEIEFDIPKTSITKLIVYDILGREVQTLINEELKAGIYKVPFDGDNLSSGTYYYKLLAGDFSQTRKMVLIK